MKYQDVVLQSICSETIVERVLIDRLEGIMGPYLHSEVVALEQGVDHDTMVGGITGIVRSRRWSESLDVDVSAFVSKFPESVRYYEDDEDFGPAAVRIKETILKDIGDGVPGRWFH